MQYKIVVDKNSRLSPSSEKKEYIIETEELRKKGDIADTIVITKDEAYVLRRLKLSEFYVLTELETPKKESLNVKIQLFEGDNYIYLVDLTGNKFYAEYTIKNELTETFATKIELSTKIEQTEEAINLVASKKVDKDEFSTMLEVNSEAVKVAWNQISDFIQMMIINNNASLAILNKNAQLLMSLDKEGINFYKSGEDVPFGEMGVKTVDKQNYINFSVLGEYGQTIQDGMAWGVTIKEDNKFLPILYIKDFSVGEKNSETGSGKLVLNSCDIVLDAMGAGIEANNVKIHGDAMPGIYFTDTNNGNSILSIIPNIQNVQSASIYMLDNISFYANQAGSNSFKIGNDNGCLFSDDGHVLCENLNCNQDIYCHGHLTARKSLDCPEGYVTGIDFINVSTEETKKNIKKFNKNAIEIIENTDIYEFNYKTEKDENKKHVGFVIGEGYNYTKEITAEKDKKEVGADIYSMISIAYKAIQEQQEQITNLKKVVSKLYRKMEGQES